MAKKQSREPFTLKKEDGVRISQCDERIRKLLKTDNIYRGGGGVVILGIAVAEELVKLAERHSK